MLKNLEQKEKTEKNDLINLPIHINELAIKIVEQLKRQSLVLSVAESFTGGGIANALVQIDGVSAVFYEGIVSYNEEAKVDRLGVDSLLLKEKGAVNEEVARQMVLGLLRSKRANIGIATTGIAGSGTDAFHTPIGRIYIAYGTLQDIYVQTFILQGNRQEIMEEGKRIALQQFYKYLLKREGKYE